MPDSGIFLRDVVQAADRLRPDTDTLSAIGRLLGFTAKAGTDVPDERRGEEGARPQDDRRQTESRTTKEPEEFLPIEVRLVRSARQSSSPFSWSVTQPFPAATTEQDEPPPPLVPLLRPLWSRAILTSALGTKVAEGEIDIARVVDLLARKIAITAIPRLGIPTLRHGVQVLVQSGPTMVPFVRDQEHLLRALRPVAGRERVEVFDFAGVPTRGVYASDGSMQQYTPPLRRKTVVLLSDLGIGRGGEIVSISEWLEFARIVRRARCPLVAFVPYPPARWPAELRRAMIIVQWDRNTTAAKVRGSVARGGGSR